VKRTLLAITLLILGISAARAQKLTGAGATFPYPIYSKWFAEYSAAHPGVQINYQPIGSGGGIRQVGAGVIDFGASDEPLSDFQLAESRVKVVQIPTVMGAVVPIFNVPGVTEIRFSPEVLAGIYLGKIRKWNDPRLATDNPGVKLPDLNINVVHRSDGSGTSYIFTDYLSKISPGWANGPGRSISPYWPVGVGEKGNDSVAGVVLHLPGAIGYVELIYAQRNQVAFGEVKNSSGNWIKASVETVTNAGADIRALPADFRVSITNAPGPNAYPISSFTWLLVPVRSLDAKKGKIMQDLLSWILRSGQGEVGSLSYAPLPSSLLEQELRTVYSLR
jgi:phosphate transport system substrate-binding protein